MKAVTPTLFIYYTIIVYSCVLCTLVHPANSCHIFHLLRQGDAVEERRENDVHFESADPDLVLQRGYPIYNVKHPGGVG